MQKRRIELARRLRAVSIEGKRVAAALGVVLLLGAPAVAHAYTAEIGSGATEAEEQRAKEDAEIQRRENQEAKEKEEHEHAAAQQASEQHAREQAQQEEEAKRARVAQEEAAQERQEQLAKESQSKEHATVRCEVPNLVGSTLVAARKELTVAHCKLGKVDASKPSRGKLVVTWQSVHRGSSRPSGTAVSVRLGSRGR